MRSELLRVLNFVSKIDQMEEPPALLAELRAQLAPFGVCCLSVSLIQVGGQAPNPQVLDGRRWRPWPRRPHITGGWGEDPIVRQVLAQVRPFTFSDCDRVEQSCGREAIIGCCQEEASCREGFVVPVRDADGAVLTGAFSGPLVDLQPEVRSALQIVGTYLVLRGRELVERSGSCNSCPLSTRQIECLRWARAGKTDAEIGVLLGISARTVHNHLEKAKSILNTPKRAVAAAEAWAQGWLALPAHAAQSSAPSSLLPPPDLSQPFAD